jgi:hypothetical protein
VPHGRALLRVWLHCCFRFDCGFLGWERSADACSFRRAHVYLPRVAALPDGHGAFFPVALDVKNLDV